MVYQISSPTQTGITYLGNGTVVNNTITTIFPKQTITMFVIQPKVTGQQYDFETGTQGWLTTGNPIASVTSTTAQHFTGAKSLAVNFTGNAGTASAYVKQPVTPASSAVTYHVWIPSGSQIASLQAYVEQPASGGYTYTYVKKSISQLTVGAWNTITVNVPPNAVTPLYALGVSFTTAGSWTGTCYVDAVGW